MNNLGDLFQVAPTTAGFMLGGQIADDRKTAEMQRQSTLQDIMAKQQAYDQNTQMNPLLVEKQRTLNQGYGLENESKTMENRKTRETLDSTISSTNSKNSLDDMQNHIKKAAATEEFFNKAADQLKYLPPAVRSSWLSQAMNDNGIDPRNPQVQQLVMQASQNPALLSQHATAIAQERAARSADYIKAMAEKDAEGRNQLANTREHNKGSKEVAEINQRGRVQAASIRAGKTVQDIQTLVLQGKIKLPEMPAAFEQAARMAQDPEERDYLLEQARKANQMLLDRVNARPNSTVKDGEIQTNTTGPVYGGPAKPKGSGTADDPIVLE